MGDEPMMDEPMMEAAKSDDNYAPCEEDPM